MKTIQTTQLNPREKQNNGEELGECKINHFLFLLSICNHLFRILKVTIWRVTTVVWRVTTVAGEIISTVL